MTGPVFVKRYRDPDRAAAARPHRDWLAGLECGVRLPALRSTDLHQPARGRRSAGGLQHAHRSGRWRHDYLLTRPAARLRRVPPPAHRALPAPQRVQPRVARSTPVAETRGTPMSARARLYRQFPRHTPADCVLADITAEREAQHSVHHRDHHVAECRRRCRRDDQLLLVLVAFGGRGAGGFAD